MSQSSISPLQKARSSYQPKLPSVLTQDPKQVTLVKGQATQSVSDAEAIKSLFPKTYGQPEVHFQQGVSSLSNQAMKVGLVLSGGQAPGGHNVVSGLFDGLKKLNASNQLFGFLGGPSGILNNKFKEITASLMDEYRNTGGFDIIGSGRTKLETTEQFETCRKNLQAQGISVLVVVGGDDSNTNAAVLAEYFAQQNAGIRVVGAPKTIDGDLKNTQIEVSFGFDTATKVYAELVGNVARDAMSAKKYWHFIKLMGRSASHIALEVALKTQPSICLVSEEVAAKKQTLNEITDSIAQVVAKRAEQGKNFGIVLVPEGLVEFIPEMKSLISELNDLLAHEAEAFAKQASTEAQVGFVLGKLGAASQQTFRSLPRSIQGQLLADRDPHGNVQVSRIETEKLLIETVGARLAAWKAEGKYKGAFSGLAHFFGYEGRCAAPSNFDADYCYALGFNAAYLAASGVTGYLSSVQQLTKPAAQWKAGGVPITMMMNLEKRHGQQKPVIQKALVDLHGKPFQTFTSQRERWAVEDAFLYPGPIQYWGPGEVADAITETLKLEH